MVLDLFINVSAFIVMLSIKLKLDIWKSGFLSIYWLLLSILFLLFSYIKEGESLFPKKTKIEKNVNDSKELPKILKSFEIELGKLNQSKIDLNALQKCKCF